MKSPGRVDTRPGDAIPRILHRIWVGGPMPDVYDHGSSWQEMLPGWDLRLWTEPADIPLLSRVDDLAPPHDRARWQVDVWRLHLLYEHGGIYVDCDAVPLRTLDPLLDHDAFVAQSPNDTSLATNAVMGCRPGHPFLGRLLDGLEGRAERYAGRRVVESVGGFYITDMLGDDVTVLPWWWFAAHSISDRREGRPADPRNAAEGFVDHRYQNTR